MVGLNRIQHHQVKTRHTSLSYGSIRNQQLEPAYGHPESQSFLQGLQCFMMAAATQCCNISALLKATLSCRGLRPVLAQVDPLILKHRQCGGQYARVAVKVQELLQQQAKFTGKADAIVLSQLNNLCRRTCSASALLDVYLQVVGSIPWLTNADELGQNLCRQRDKGMHWSEPSVERTLVMICHLGVSPASWSYSHPMLLECLELNSIRTVTQGPV